LVLSGSLGGEKKRGEGVPGKGGGKGDTPPILMVLNLPLDLFFSGDQNIRAKKKGGKGERGGE